MTADDFREEINGMIKKAREGKLSFIDITSGDVHRKVGGYPSRDHRMASCCDVMYSLMKTKDEILYAPPKGKGATLKIRYYL